MPEKEEYTFTKPDIPEDRLLVGDESARVLNALRAERKLVQKGLLPIKNDYTDDAHRGTVEYNQETVPFEGRIRNAVRNYSFHKVVIPDGSFVRECNFSQAEPFTDAIVGENITFIDCNLRNVNIRPSWILQGCLTIHGRTRDVVEGDKEFTVHEIYRDNEWTEISRDAKPSGGR